MDPTFSNYTPEQKAALFAPKPTLGAMGDMYGSEGEALLANYNMQGAGGVGGNAPQPAPIQTRQQISDANTAHANGQGAPSSVSGPSGFVAPASAAPVASSIWSGGSWRLPNSLSLSTSDSLPLNSPLIPAAAYAIEATVKALSNLQIIVVDSAGVQHSGTIMISGGQAVLYVHL